MDAGCERLETSTRWWQRRQDNVLEARSIRTPQNIKACSEWLGGEGRKNWSRRGNHAPVLFEAGAAPHATILALANGKPRFFATFPPPYSVGLSCVRRLLEIVECSVTSSFHWAKAAVTNHARF